eukprot:scaffold207840_cov28-Tisochrysis_lutea.AAC.1
MRREEKRREGRGKSEWRAPASTPTTTSMGGGGWRDVGEGERDDAADIVHCGEDVVEAFG